MLSAVDFLPSYISEFMNRVITTSPNLASGRISRFTARRRRLIALPLLLRPLRAVQRPALTTLGDALRVEHATQDVIADARQVLHAPATDQHHRVLLQVVPLAGDVAHDLEAIGQAHLRHLAQRRVRLLRRGGVDARADAALLRAALQRRHRVPAFPGLAPLRDELVDGRH